MIFWRLLWSSISSMNIIYIYTFYQIFFLYWCSRVECVHGLCCYRCRICRGDLFRRLFVGFFPLSALVLGLWVLRCIVFCIVCPYISRSFYCAFSFSAASFWWPFPTPLYIFMLIFVLSLFNFRGLSKQDGHLFIYIKLISLFFHAYPPRTDFRFSSIFYLRVFFRFNSFCLGVIPSVLQFM